MRNFYFKRELSKGYIPSDKVHYNNQPYELGGSEQLHAMIKSIYNNYEGNLKCSSILHDLGTVIANELETIAYEPKDKSIKPFYLNINRDGVDIFVHRWNWVEKKDFIKPKEYTCSDCDMKYTEGHSCEQMVNNIKAIG